MRLFKTLGDALLYYREDLPPDQQKKAQTVIEVETTHGKNAFVISTNQRRRIPLLNKKEKPPGIKSFLSFAFDFKEALRKEKERRIEENLPGLTIMREAQADAAEEVRRYVKGYRQMLEEEHTDRQPLRAYDDRYEKTFRALSEKYPRAYQYLVAENYALDSYWTDFDPFETPLKGMKILIEGGSQEEAEELIVQEYNNSLAYNDPNYDWDNPPDNPPEK